MKMFRKTEDGAIENLLRAHAARAGSPPAPCREFDPDLANAFIEHSLTASERGRYEQHLSLCPSCRKSVVALARMAASDPAFSSQAKPLRLIPETEPRWKALLGAMSRPQWAMAAAAVVLLAISVPLFLSKDGKFTRQSVESQVAQSPSGDASAETKAAQQTPANELAEGSQVQGTPSELISKNQQDKSATKAARAADTPEEEAEQPAAEKGAGESSGALARLAPPRIQPIESKGADQAADQSASKEMNQSPSAAGVPVPEQAPETQLEKIDADKAKSVPEQSKDTEVSVLQPGRPDGGERRSQRDAVVRTEEIAPPPAPSTRSRERNAITSASGGLNSRLTDPARNRGSASERKIGSKKFWLKDDMWVDKDYNPNKEMPVITIIRDSDVYKELLSKRQGMKSFLTGFAESDRVIFIYKGTVYKLIPQEGKK